MQENIESFVHYFGPEHCFEFSITASQLTPEEFGRRMNSCVTNCLRELMPDRIGVLEPHKSGHAHQHTLVALPFTSPNFDHEALRKSREAFKRKDFAESKRQWQKVRESMSPEHAAMWDLLQRELPKYGLGKQIGFAPIQHGPRAIACYFGKYLTKGIASRPETWKRVRLVRYSGTNGQSVPPWKQATPLRSGNTVHDQNRRDKIQALAREIGAGSPEEMKATLGSHWYFHGRKIVARIKLPVYRSLLHADADLDGNVRAPNGLRIDNIPAPPDQPWASRTEPTFPPESYLPYSPKRDETRPDAVSPREAAILLWEALSPFKSRQGALATFLRAFPGPPASAAGVAGFDP